MSNKSILNVDIACRQQQFSNYFLRFNVHTSLGRQIILTVTVQVTKCLASHHVGALLCRLSLLLCFPQTHAMCSQHLWLYRTMHHCHVGLSCNRSPPRRRPPVREASAERGRVRRPRGYRRKASSLSASPARYTPQPPQEHEPQPAPKPQPTGNFCVALLCQHASSFLQWHSHNVQVCC